MADVATASTSAAVAGSSSNSGGGKTKAQLHAERLKKLKELHLKRVS